MPLSEVTASRLRLIINILYYAAIAVLFWLAVKYALPVLLPFIAAFGIAAMLKKPIAALRRRIPRLGGGVAAFAVVAVFLAVAGLLLVLLCSVLFRQLGSLFSSLYDTLELLMQSASSGQAYSSLPEWLATPLRNLLARLEDDFPTAAVDALGRLGDLLTRLVGAAVELAGKLPAFVLGVLVTVIAALFISVDYDGVVKLLRSCFPENLHGRLSKAKRCFSTTVLALLRTYALLMLLTFTELCIGFAAIDLAGAEINYVIPLAFIIALVDILPVVGVGRCSSRGVCSTC